MRGLWGRCGSLVLPANFAFGAVLLFGVIAGSAFFGTTDLAQALPSFARQTGQACGACHTDFPGLTPFGRQFKLGGYTLGGGQFRTTLFPTAEDESKKALAAYAKKTARTDSASPPAADTSNMYVPPISVMAVVGWTHTQAPFMDDPAPWNVNDNLVLSPASLFFGGAITEHIGAFVQGTYNAPGFGPPADPYTHKFTWDNTDVRFANKFNLAGLDVTYGITANNNPTVQDLWNTTPAWGFPYVSSTLAERPGASTIIDGRFAAHVGGVGAYAYINNLLYLEISGYQTLNFNTQNRLGTDPFGAPGLFSNWAPYWRVAIEPNWGDFWVMVGAFGMTSQVKPWMDSTGATSLDVFAQADKYRDIGFDAQVQYKGPNYWATIRATYITEQQTLDGSFAKGLSNNPTNKLNTMRAYASLAYGNDNRVVVTGQYFTISGTADELLYAANTDFSPNSNGWVAEIAYIPFVTSPAPGWPWFNARIGLQYTYYNKFNGDTVFAHDHNTVFLYAWFAL